MQASYNSSWLTFLFTSSWTRVLIWYVPGHPSNVNIKEHAVNEKMPLHMLACNKSATFMNTHVAGPL